MRHSKMQEGSKLHRKLSAESAQLCILASIIDPLTAQAIEVLYYVGLTS